MDPCRRVWFTSPLAMFGQFLAIIAVFYFIIAALVAL
jgi:hypothetical protein